MYKAAAIATIASVAIASKSDFPSFDSLHANCALSATFADDCSTVFANIESTVKSFSAGGPSKGLYAIKEEGSGDYVWTTRTTPVSKYVDDIIFEVVSGSNGGCTVNGKSKSESLSYYDYSTNYCNMWNVYNTVGGASKLTPTECSWQPDDATVTCAKY